ncbi:MAG: undecaprenyl-diphosphate phosphatase [Desulfuromonadales bacterium]|nr:undecaprenyl-diphosphate phosphatase [Desulfuromonadales bacterium]
MSYLYAIVLGLVQGLTEFLPVSSSGHLAITQHFLPGFEQPGLLFDVLLHAATMAAVLLFFRREVGQLLTACFREDEKAGTDRHILRLLIIGSIPTAIIGLAGKDFFTGLFENLPVIGAMLLVTAILLLLASRVRRNGRGEAEMTITDTLLVGITQGAAIIPGISRSGSTIACLLLRGIDGETAARFSFLLALPAVGGATLLSLRDLHQVNAADLPAYAVGSLVAFVSGLLAIRFLLAVVRKRRLHGFALYCLLVGSAIILHSLLT